MLFVEKMNMRVIKQWCPLICPNQAPAGKIFLINLIAQKLRSWSLLVAKFHLFQKLISEFKYCIAIHHSDSPSTKIQKWRFGIFKTLQINSKQKKTGQSYLVGRNHIYSQSQIQSSQITEKVSCLALTQINRIKQRILNSDNHKSIVVRGNFSLRNSESE